MSVKNIVMAAAGTGDKTYVEDVFSTYLYTGNGSSQTINNGIDLAGKGGMVWTKNRTQSVGHCLIDTARGISNVLDSSYTGAQNSDGKISSVNNNGYTITGDYYNTYNGSGSNYASWTFRKAPKFFDVVTWTGDGQPTRNISHSIAGDVGMVIAKQTNSSSNWSVFHRSQNTKNAYLNTTDAFFNQYTSAGYTSGYNGEIVGGTNIFYTTVTNKFISFKTSTKTYQTSSDGFTWDSSATASVPNSTGMAGISESNGVLFSGNGSISGSTYTQYVIYSTNGGSSWNSSSTSYTHTAGYTGNTTSAYVNGVYVVSHEVGPVLYSSNLSSWSTAINQTKGQVAGLDDLFVVGIGDTNTYYTSTDGSNWTQRTAPGTISTITRVKGKNEVLIQTSSLSIYSTSNGIDWQYKSGGSGNDYHIIHRGVSFLNGYYYYGGRYYSGGVQYRIFRSSTLAQPSSSVQVVKGEYFSTSFEPAFVSAVNSTKTTVVVGLIPNGDNTVYTNTITDSSGISSASSTSFNVAYNLNVLGGTYVAYLFAHDTTTDGLIQCGSFTSGTGEVNLGWEPQWIMFKTTNSTGGWVMFDTMRGWVNSPDIGGTQLLQANTSGAEGATGLTTFQPTATGFKYNLTTDYIYMAIRRGPMRTPTDATKVFQPLARTGTGGAIVRNTVITPDLFMTKPRTSAIALYTVDRLRDRQYIMTSSTTNETTDAALPSQMWDNQTGVDLGAGLSSSGVSYIDYAFRRAKGFFDVVCFTGAGNIPHSLGVAPELMITKVRSGGNDGWNCYHKDLGNTKFIRLNTNGVPVTNSGAWNDTNPTSTVFTVGSFFVTYPFVAYLFASCPGVSKVGSYTGNGNSQTINCGFSAGARFVLIKRTDSTGNWYVWDTARGIVADNDPRLSINADAAEVTTDDTIDPDSTGFIVNQVAATNINVNAATYIYLAIA